VVQFFVQDEPRLESLVDDVAAYVRESAKGSRFSEVWLAVLREHLGDICRPEGLFVDKRVTGAAWRGRRRRQAVRRTGHRRQRGTGDDAAPPIARRLPGTACLRLRRRTRNPAHGGGHRQGDRPSALRDPRPQGVVRQHRRDGVGTRRQD